MPLPPVLVKSACLSLLLTINVAYSSPDFSIHFVKKVNSSCRHLGDVRTSFRGKDAYPMLKVFAVHNANSLFGDQLRSKAKAMGGNRLVIIDYFHSRKYYRDKAITTWVSILRTTVRARVFKCYS